MSKYKYNHKYYCLCGMTFSLSTNGRKEMENLTALMMKGHTGEGHGETTPQKAARARAKQEQREATP